MFDQGQEMWHSPFAQVLGEAFLGARERMRRTPSFHAWNDELRLKFHALVFRVRQRSPLTRANRGIRYLAQRTNIQKPLRDKHAVQQKKSQMIVRALDTSSIRMVA
jgi:hypothetical protein